MYMQPRSRYRTGWTESGDKARFTLSVLQHPDESLEAVSDLCERDRQCANTLRGSDTMHPAVSSSQRHIQTTTEYPAEEMTTRDQSHRETALLSTHNLCLRRQRHHHVHGRHRHDDRHLQLHIRLSQWLTALRLSVDKWLMALKLH